MACLSLPSTFFSVFGLSDLFLLLARSPDGGSWGLISEGKIPTAHGVRFW